MLFEQLSQSSPSPELLKALTNLLQASAKAEEKALITSAHLHAISEIFGAIAWPIVVLAAVVVFRKEVRDLIKRARKVGFAGNSIEVEDKIDKEVESSAAEVLKRPEPTPVAAVSNVDIQRSVEVANLSQDAQPDTIKNKIEQIAAEYDGVRANMPSGSDRTRQMTAIMAKMRTLGRAVYPYRSQLIGHPSPGHRLFAVASLQMLPDYNLVEWLANTTKNEAPFVQFQALQALLIAIRNAGPQTASALRQAVRIVKGNLNSEDPDKSRLRLADVLEQELSKIPNLIDIKTHDESK